MLQSRQHNLLTRLLYLTSKKHLVKNSVHLVEIKHQVELAHIPEELVQHLNEEMYGFQVGQLVVGGVHAGAEEEAGVAAVDDLAAAPELDEVGLVFLVPGRDEAVDFAFEFDLLVVGVGGVPFC